jgi:hypothetical protein
MNTALRRLLFVTACVPLACLPLACGGAFLAPDKAATAGQAEYAAAGMPAMDASEAAPAPAPQLPGAPPAPVAAKLAKANGDTAGPLDQRTLLIYEADLGFAVYRVDEGLAAVEGLARELGGHLAERGGHRIVIRVPRQRFEEALSRCDGLGQVLRRDVRSFDVTDEFRDLEVRLKNARVVRERLAELLGRAQSVEDSLKIERELARLTEEIERLTGTLENLTGRIAFSKITVSFEPRRTEPAPERVRLPFSFLDNLGLSPLFNLSE